MKKTNALFLTIKVLPIIFGLVACVRTKSPVPNETSPQTNTSLLNIDSLSFNNPPEYRWSPTASGYVWLFQFVNSESGSLAQL
jgi:hypothetical protein